MTDPDPNLDLNFADTEIAFSNKSDSELKKTSWLFKMMNNHTLVKYGSKLALIAIRFRIPSTETIVRLTIFPQFCGGENLLDCQKTIDKLYEYDTLAMLDYGAEGKSDEDDLDAVLEETLRALEMAASNNSVPVVISKMTGLVDNIILEKVQKKQILTPGEQRKYDHLLERVNEICERAAELEVSIFIDAEESWIQDPIDEIALLMMEKYNQEKAIIYNTYQLYRINKLAQIEKDHARCIAKGVIFGAKLVRGAYMDKERDRAEDLGYPSPIQPNKAACDKDYNDAITYCVDHYETISSCCASHNAESNMLQAKLMFEKEIDRDHPHLNFCQLYGMSDNITFNLSNAGYNAAKYVVYGPIKEVIPYLIRRTEENASVTGEMSRERSLVEKEMKRRGL